MNILATLFFWTLCFILLCGIPPYAALLLALNVCAMTTLREPIKARDAYSFRARPRFGWY